MLSQKVATLNHMASEVSRCEILVEGHSRLPLFLHMVNIMCEMLLATVAPVVQESDVPDRVSKKSLGSAKFFLVERKFPSKL